jgi:hypothetical protein
MVITFFLSEFAVRLKYGITRNNIIIKSQILVRKQEQQQLFYVHPLKGIRTRPIYFSG